jgi:type VI secretion system protein ImpF
MFAFRSAHAARDATKKIDLRDEAGDRVIAGRRSVGRAPNTPTVARHATSRR